MVQLVPVKISNSSSGTRWYAGALTYSIIGRGSTPEEAIAELKSSIERIYPEDSVELFIRGVNVTFPRSLSDSEFSEWIKDRAATTI